MAWLPVFEKSFVLSCVKQSSVDVALLFRQQLEIVRVMETSSDAAGESVSQDLRFCTVEFAVPQWSLMCHASCSASVCKIARGCGRWRRVPVLCVKHSFVMSHFSSTQVVIDGDIIQTVRSQRRLLRFSIMSSGKRPCDDPRQVHVRTGPAH